MRVLLFAHLKALIGQTELELSVRDGATMREFWDQLLEAHPALSAQREVVRVASNREFATAQTCFNNSDEVALIPPVSGG